MLLLSRRVGQSIFLGVPDQKIEVVVMDLSKRGWVTLGFIAHVWVPIWRDDVINRKPRELDSEFNRRDEAARSSY